MTIPKVENMDSPRTGAKVANQFIITTKEGRYFQSYKTVIAFIPSKTRSNGYYGSTVFLDESAWNYSATTSKYRNQFLRETTAETRRKIKSGEYKLMDLNK